MSYTTATAPPPGRTGAPPLAGPAANAAAAGAAAALPKSPNKLGLFGMVSEQCLEQIRRHVLPIKGLHPWTAQAIYTALAVCASKQGQASVADGQRCRITVAELADRTGMCRRNIERYLPVLQSAGVIKIVHAHDALHRPVASHFLFIYPHTGSGDTPTRESGIPDAGGAAPAQSPTRESDGSDSGVGTVSKSQRERKESGPERARFVLEREEHEEDEERVESAATALDQPATSLEGTTLPTGNEGTLTGTQHANGARWRQARELLRGQVSDAAFNAWLEPLRTVPERATGQILTPGGEDDAPLYAAGNDEGSAVSHEALATPRPASGVVNSTGVMVLACRNAFQRDQIERRYRAAIEAALNGPVSLIVEPAQGPPA